MARRLGTAAFAVTEGASAGEVWRGRWWTEFSKIAIQPSAEWPHLHLVVLQLQTLPLPRRTGAAPRILASIVDRGRALACTDPTEAAQT